jgi:hypothetical protein
MAPATSHDDWPPTVRALLQHLPTRRDTTSHVLVKRAAGTTGYLAVIVVLSAIIVGEHAKFLSVHFVSILATPLFSLPPSLILSVFITNNTY